MATAQRETGTLTTALKEWAVTVQALERGDQIAVLRKGGIAEKGQRFTPRSEAFLLFPTFEHQDRESLRPAYHGLLEETARYRHQENRIPIGSWAEVARTFRVEAVEPLLDLADEFVWSEAEIRGRWAWKPERPLYLLALRVHRLPTVRELPLQRQYSGCRSWVELHDAVELEGSRPALDASSFTARLERLAQNLGG